MPDRHQPNIAVISILVIVLLAGATVGTIALTKKSDSDIGNSSQSEQSSTSAEPETNTTSNNGSYKDGTYTKTGTYITPGGQESVAVTVTLTDGVVTATSIKGSGSNGNTVEYQGRFIAGYKDLVIGKSIDEVSLSRVSGSSLTSNGFNRAIEAIKKMPNPASHRFEAIGTQWEIVTSAELSTSQWKTIQHTIDMFDKTYSRFRPDSLVSHMATTAGTYTFPNNFEALFSLYEKLYTITSGRMTPLIGATLADLGYDASYSLRPKRTIAKTPPLETIIRKGLVVTTSKPVTLDVGAAGKGFLVDEIAAILDTYQVAYVIDASGDIRVSAAWHERVGLESPRDATRVLGVAELQGQSLCGSALNRRTWGKGIHHIIDPQTSHPTKGVQATWVVADTAFVADALATALFFVTPDKLKGFEFTYVRLMEDNSLQYSTNFNGELFV